MQESLLQDLTNECRALKESCEVRTRKPPFNHELCSNDSRQTKSGSRYEQREILLRSTSLVRLRQNAVPNERGGEGCDTSVDIYTPIHT